MSSPWAVRGQLPWAPPTLTSPTTIVMDDTNAKRHMLLTPGKDYIIVAPNIISDYSKAGYNDALVTIHYGRNIVWIGGHICAQRPTPAVLTSAIAATDGAGATFTVNNGASLLAPITVRIDGESMQVSSVVGNVCTIVARNVGFYNDTPVSSKTTHRVGARVYVDSQNRGAVSFYGQTGTVHLEGIQMDGFHSDGVRVFGGTAGSVMQIQNCRIGPVSNYDLAYETDTHPDCIQTYQGGFPTIKVARSTLACGPNGNGILNQSLTPATTNFVLQDMEIQSRGFHRSMAVNIDVATVWTVSNAWIRSTAAAPNLTQLPWVNDHNAATLGTQFQYRQIAPGDVDTVPASMLAGYVSPGYAA